MSKIKTNIYTLNQSMLAQMNYAYNIAIRKSHTESPSTDKKPYGILCNDWNLRYNAWPMKGVYRKQWRAFRHYRTEKARDRALDSLKKEYKLTSIKFIPSDYMEKAKNAASKTEMTFWQSILGYLPRRTGSSK